MNYQIAGRMKNARGSIIRDLLKLANEPGMISFGGGNPDPSTFPIADIARLSNEILSENPVSVLQYGISEGYPPLRKTMKEYLKKTEHIGFDDNELFILSGGQQCADLTAKVFVNEGDTVVTELPSFIGCMNAFRSYGANLVGVPMEKDGVDLQRLEDEFKKQKVSLFYIITTFQNPTGYTTSAEKRKQIYKLAQKYDVMIFEDNPYGELRFDGEWIAPIKSLDTDGRVVYAGSFSKTMAPAFRLGMLIFPNQISNPIKISKQATDVHSSVLFQYITNEYITKCDYHAHLEATRALYRKKCGIMMGEMEKHFHPDVKYTRPLGGFFMMAFMPEGVDTLPFVNEGIKRGVITVPGSAFTPDPTLPNKSFRLNYSTPSEEQIVKGIKILGELTYEMLK